MTKEAVLRLLRQTEGFVSGQQMSQELKLSRAAVWKAVQALKAEGYAIDSVTNKGYRLTAGPDRLCKDEICRHLGQHPWADRLMVLEEVDSTNTLAKKLAAEGAPSGTVVVADCQIAGKGRLGRSFASPPGVGVYLSVIFRPEAAPSELMHLTAVAAVAAAEAVRDVTGLGPGIKWTNDLVIGKRKLAGILTELSLQAETATVDYAVVGIGTNCNHVESDFPEAVQPIAISLHQALDCRVDRNAYAAALIRRLSQAQQTMQSHKEQWMRQYEAACVTVGKEVKIIRGSTERLAKALGIDEDGGLLVRYDDGTEATVNSGEVSVRGMYGYL